MCWHFNKNNNKNSAAAFAYFGPDVLFVLPVETGFCSGRLVVSTAREPLGFTATLADADDFTKGSVRFPFRNLEKGLHHIKFTAWDTHNNPVTSELNFVVTGEDQITLSNVLNYPNPFVSYTQFWFSHDRPFEPLDVQVQIFTVTGKVVKTINQTVITEGFLSREITWDGRDDFGDKIGKGVYIYRLKVKSTLTNKISEKVEKLVIL